jgi:hypothetical protein
MKDLNRLCKAEKAIIWLVAIGMCFAFWVIVFMVIKGA